MLTISLLLTCSSFALVCEDRILDLGLTESAGICIQEPGDSEVAENPGTSSNQEPEEGSEAEGQEPGEDEAAEQEPDADEEIEEEFEEEVEVPLTSKEAAELLETALKSRELDLIFAAIDEAGRIPGKSVIKQLGKAVKHKDTEVRLDALNALRFNEDPTATKELFKFKKYKPVLENELCAEAYFMALGQKGDVKALPILTDKLHVTNRNDKPTRARIVAIGHIRDVKSVEALISMMNSGAGRRSHPNMKEMNLALQVLTGANVKSNRDAWQKWWNDNRKGLDISEKEQEAATKKGRATWKMLWADPEDAELMKEALKRGKTDFADADEDELKKLREKAEARKKGGDGKDDDADDEKDGDDDDAGKDDGDGAEDDDRN